MKMRVSGGRKRQVLVIASTAAAVMVVGCGVAAGVTVTGTGHGRGTARPGGTQAQASPAAPSARAAANVKPAVTASKASESSPAKHTPTGKAPATQPARTPTSPSTASQAMPQTSPPSAGSQSLTLTNNFPTSAKIGDAYSGTITVSGGRAPYTWATAWQHSSFGVTATPDGATLTLSGTIDAAGNYNLEVSVHDSSAPQRTVTENIPVNIAISLSPLTFIQLPTYMGQGTVGVAFSFQPGEVQGGRTPYTWTVTGLPPGLTATKIQDSSANPFSVTGTPTTAGTFYITATVRDNENPPQTLTRHYEIQIDPAPWSITTNLPNGTAGVPYTGHVAVTNGVTATWTADGLPPGLTINPDTGTISGTPTAAFDSTITVYATVTQPDGSAKTQWLSTGMVINPAPSPTSTSLLARFGSRTASAAACPQGRPAGASATGRTADLLLPASTARILSRCSQTLTAPR